MSAPSAVLVIVFGSVNSNAFSFEFDGEKYHLLKTHQILTIDDSNLIVSIFKNFFKKKFDEIFVLGKDTGEDLGFFEALKLMSSRLPVKDSESDNSRVSTLVVDLGAKKTWVGSEKLGKVSLKKYDFGLGKGIKLLNKKGMTESLACWIPEETNFSTLENYLAQKSIYPGVLPAEKESLLFEQAAVVEILRCVNWDLFNWDEIERIVLTGGFFAGVPSQASAALYFLNGAQPQGIFQVFLDRQQVFSALGGLQLLTGKATYSLFEENFVNLGTIINLSHKFPLGKNMGKFFLSVVGNERLEFSLKSGEIIRIPFEKGMEGSLDLMLVKGVEVLGVNSGGLQVEGGELGIILDVRGRPVPRPALNKEGKQTLERWEKSLKG